MSIITLSGILLIILIIAFIFIGMKFKKVTTSSEDFLLAGRGAPFWLTAAAAVGGGVGGASVSGWTGYGYGGGLTSIWLAIFPILGVVFFCMLFVRRLNNFGRENKAVTITDFLCIRYGEQIRVPAAIISFFRPAFLVGMQLLAIAIVFRVAFGWSIQIGVFISAVIIIAYLVTAGQYSALVTQWLQTILQSGSIIIFTILAFKMAGGFTETVDAFYTVLPETFVNCLSVTFSDFSVWILTMCLFFMVDPYCYMQAYLGETPRVSQNAQLLSSGSMAFGITVFFGGMALAVAAGNGTLVLPADLAPDAIYAFVSMNHAPMTLGTVLIVGLLMTIISCGSGFAMNGVTILTNDIYNKVINKNASEKQMLFASRCSVVIVIAVGAVGALWVPNLVPLWVLTQAICISGLLAPVMCAWFWKRSTTTGALLSCIGGGLAAIGWALYAWSVTGTPGGLVFGLHAAHVGLLVSIPLMIIVSLATKADYKMAERTAYHELGLKVQENNRLTGDLDGPGFFGRFGATTSVRKLGWALVIAMIICHYIFMLAFRVHGIGYVAVVEAIGYSAVLLVIFTVCGGKDVMKMFGRTAGKKN